MKIRIFSTFTCPLVIGALLSPAPALAEESDARRIEEVIVTAEKRQATVSDTSISITAFGQDRIEDLGLQGADEMINFIPATTRDAYDIRIRGVGRNFRALGGDPGVATYYNGVYSEDFGIASSEGALYDVERIEVLRGPQGTLYGRNSIGGALNYISNKPSFEGGEAEVKAIFGNLGTQEYYGYVTGPIIADRLAMRLVASRRDRDGGQEGIDGSEDVNSIGDQNVALSLTWRLTDNIEWNARYNDRRSDRRIGESVLVEEGTSLNRNLRCESGDTSCVFGNNQNYALGLMAPIPGYTGPTLDFGGGVEAVYRRPGVDGAATYRPNAAYGQAVDVYDDDIEDLNGWSMTNDRNDETFKHQAVQTDFTIDINDTTSLKYIGGWMDFTYTYFQDIDQSTGDVSRYYQTVIQDTETQSHELQLLWQIGDNLEMTSGLYYFDQTLRQRYNTNDDGAQGRFTDATDYGLLERGGPFLPGGAGLVDLIGGHKRLGEATPGTWNLGIWEGDPMGQVYGIDNTVATKAYAAFTQGTYTFNESWALTLGIRWAQDDKEADEQRAFYFEDNGDIPTFLGSLAGVWTGTCLSIYGVDCATAGTTNQAAQNIVMGAAAPTFDPMNPIVPICDGGAGGVGDAALTNPNCGTPLRLQGLPISVHAGSTDKKSWDNISWRANLDWSPVDDHLFYLSATTGYRAGGYSLGVVDAATFNPDLTFPAPPSYDKETMIAYELGWKGTLVDGRVQLFASLYHYDYDDYQDEINVLNTTTGSAESVVVNFPKAANTGFEVEATWLATDSLTVGGNYSYTRTEAQSEILVAYSDNPEQPTGPGLFDEEIVNFDGNDLKRIPRNKAALWGAYDIPMSIGTLTLGGSYSYTGEQYDSGAMRELDKIPERHRMDLYLAFRDNRDQFRFRAFVDNVTDEGNARGIGTGGAAENYRYTATYLYPRFYGIELAYRFANL